MQEIRELKKAGLANFEEGNVENINWDEPIDEQADLLPYDRKFEFPREKLKLGKQLGAGAFGVVVKATAEGILPYEEESVVAVKMVKKQTDNEVMRALVSELKIMVHLGQHLNVVNLLGAVTKNIAQREVMVIVEYCRFGNLQAFLVKHRPYYIDQVVKGKDIIDPTIQFNELKWSKDAAYTYNRLVILFEVFFIVCGFQCGLSNYFFGTLARSSNGNALFLLGSTLNFGIIFNNFLRFNISDFFPSLHY